MLDFIQKSAELFLSEKVVENVMTSAKHVANITGISEVISNDEEFYPAYMHYDLQLRRLCKDLNNSYNVIRDAVGDCQKYIGQTYEEPTSLSSNVGEFLGFGAYFLAGGGIVGASSKLAVNNIVEPLVRKAQFSIFEENIKYNKDYISFDDVESIPFEGLRRNHPA